jgi:hypothetical protein
MYADDVMLLANSLTDMQKMLNCCNEVMNNLDMSFNVHKSFVTRIGRRFNKSCIPLLLDGQEVAFTRSLKYLGVVIKAGVKATFDTCNVKIAFYRSFNKLQSKCASANSELISCHIIRAICVPILSYACEALSLTRSVIRNLDSLIANAIRRSCNINDTGNITSVRIMFGIDGLEDIIRRRSCKFLLKIGKRSDVVSNVVFRLAVNSCNWFTKELNMNCKVSSSGDICRALRRLYCGGGVCAL